VELEANEHQNDGVVVLVSCDAKGRASKEKCCKVELAIHIKKKGEDTRLICIMKSYG
jgi:hypothetical protein